MALKPEDPNNGFRHGNVVDFINKRMSKHATGPEFYLENLSLSWEATEDKIEAILENSEISSEAQEACTWASLALAVRLVCRQRHLQERRMQWLQDFTKRHKSAVEALASNLRRITEQQERERNEAAFRLQLAHAKLAQAQNERDLLRCKLLQAELRALPQPIDEGQGQAPDKSETPGASKEEAAGGATGTTEGRTEEKRDATGATSAEVTLELGGNLLQFLEVVQKENYTSDRETEGGLWPTETTSLYVSETLKPKSTISPPHLPVQLPASFTYCYSSPLSPFPATPTTSLPAANVTKPGSPLMPPNCSTSGVSLWFEEGAQGIGFQEPQNGRRDTEHHYQKKYPALRRPGDWKCPWCKAVNFSRRQTCFRCGRGIWLQSPQ